MSDFGTSTSVALNTLAVGDIIHAYIIIDKADMADPSSKSGTSKKIRQGKPVERFCVVLAVSATSVTVTYLATFSKATTLPTTLDKNYWYPVDPATKEGTLDPLPALNTRAQWASLRKKQEITEATVKKWSVSATADSASKILDQMKA